MSIDEEIDELKKKIVSLEALLPIVSEAERIAIRQQIAGTSNEKAALTIIKGQHDAALNPTAPLKSLRTGSDPPVSDCGDLLVELFNYWSLSSSIQFTARHATYILDSDLASPHSKSEQVSVKSDTALSREIFAVNGFVASQELRKRKTKVLEQGS